MRERCDVCDSTLVKNDTACPVCRKPVEKEEGPSLAQRRFQIFLTGFLCLMVLLVGLSVFVDLGPSFGMLLAITVVLVLVRNSAVEMTSFSSSSSSGNSRESSGDTPKAGR